jgi:hypothetical protein
MVWPILISVAVTPRISAAVEAAGELRSAIALSAPSLVTKRIDASPIYSGAQKPTAAGAVGPLAPGEETCHDAGMDANHKRFHDHRFLPSR